MKISRRKFIVAVPVVAGIVSQLNGVTPGRSLSSVSRAMTVGGDALSRLSWDSFLQFVNTDFTVGEGPSAVTLTLADMTDSRPYGSLARKYGQENFVLKFTGPGGEPLTQGTYRVNHFSLGEFDLFITDGGRAKRNNYYLAVINRVLL